VANWGDLKTLQVAWVAGRSCKGTKEREIRVYPYKKEKTWGRPVERGVAKKKRRIYSRERIPTSLIGTAARGDLLELSRKIGRISLGRVPTRRA